MITVDSFPQTHLSPYSTTLQQVDHSVASPPTHQKPMKYPQRTTRTAKKVNNNKNYLYNNQVVFFPGDKPYTNDPNDILGGIQ